MNLDQSLVVPEPAERAKTIAARGCRPALLPINLRRGGRHATSAGQPDSTGKVRPPLHHVHPSGSCAIMLRTDHPLVAQVVGAPASELSVVLELADPAPVPLRQPVRGLLWITGWLATLGAAEARREAVAVAERRPDSRLLDVGHGMTMLRLTPGSLVVADTEGTASVHQGAFAEADPDPFCHDETRWLRHLDTTHRDVVHTLADYLPDNLRGGHIRPLGVDRWGLRLRVEASTGDHDVRLGFSAPVSTPAELATELRRLVGCTFETVCS